MKTKLLSVAVAVAVMAMMSLNTARAQAPVASGQGDGGLGEISEEISAKTRHPLTQQGVAPTNKFIINLYMYRAPVRSSPNWVSVANAEVRQMVNNNVTNDLGNQFPPDLIIQDSSLSRDVLWVGAKIRGQNGEKITPNKLRFTQWSSDSANSLANTYSTAGGSFIYNAQTVGVVYSTNGPGVNDTYWMAGEDGQSRADELDFSGVQTPYYIFHSDGEYATDKNYVITQNLAITTRLDIIGADGSVQATAFRTVKVNPDASFGNLSIWIKSVPQGMVQVGYAGDQYQSAILESSTTVTGNWTQIATLNNGQYLTLPANNKMFFRLRRF